MTRRRADYDPHRFGFCARELEDAPIPWCSTSAGVCAADRGWRSHCWEPCTDCGSVFADAHAIDCGIPW